MVLVTRSQYINAGEIENKGLELTLNATPVKTGDFTWDIAFNMGMNRNKVVKLTETVKEFLIVDSGFGRSATPVVREGESYGDMLGFFWMNSADVYDGSKLISHSEAGTRLVTASGAPLSSITTGAQAVLGNFNPKATLGLTNILRYKDFALRILIDGRVGGTIMDGTEQLLAYNGAPEVTANYREGGWNLGGQDANGNEVASTINAQTFWTTASGGRYGTAEFFTYDATNFRVREVSLGYSIPLASSFPLKQARISLVARNLFFLYRGSSRMDIPGLGKRRMDFDPDMALGNGNWQGISYGTLPSTRSIGLNVQLTF